MKGKRFYVLPYSLHEEHIPHLMGRIVQDPTNPLRRFIPDPEGPHGFNPEDIIPNILRNPIPYENRSDIVRAGSGAKLRARLTSYLGLEVSKIGSNSLELQAEEVKRYEMINSKLAFRKFVEDERYRKQIEELLAESKNGEVLMVVGFYTAKKSSWSTTEEKERGVDVDVQVPVAAIAGVPLVTDIDPGVGVSINVQRENGMKGEVVQVEEIFAVAYDVIKTKHSFDKNAKRWVSSTPVLGDEKRVHAGHLGMNGGESDDELEYSPEEETEKTLLSFLVDENAVPQVDASVGYLEF